MGYVLITGGSFINKGAQSMVFITVCEIKRRFPQKDIVVLSDIDATRYAVLPEKDGEFQFLLRDNVCIYGWKYKLLQHRYGKLDRYGDAAKIRKNVDMIIDISGYTFGSNFGWMSSFLAAYRVNRAKKYKAPIYYMPQSFGPFEWKGIFGKITDACIRRWLPYAEVIYAREDEGARLLIERYGFSNVVLSNDMVLLNKGIDLHSVYKKIPDAKAPEIGRNSVAVLPNVRNYQYGNKRSLMKAYRIIIDLQLAKGRTVYLIRHATDDLVFCQEIKMLYESNSKVVLVKEDFECWEYEKFVQKFDYLVASRYHAIVHAYKCQVPCIVLGWATKYQELLSKFGQEKYALDVRGNIDGNELSDIVKRMEKNYDCESETIGNILKQLQKTDVFDCLKVGGTNGE